MTSPLFSAFLETPLGWLQITGTETFLTEITFLDEAPEEPENQAALPEPLQAGLKQLKEYFLGHRRNFELPLNPNGTEFQQKVWGRLQEIPFGKTYSYLDIALMLGEKTYTRAVGMANGKNPLALVVPCHRVIGANGSLTGYAGGLWRKKWLLNFEGATQQTELFPA